MKYRIIQNVLKKKHQQNTKNKIITKNISIANDEQRE